MNSIIVTVIIIAIIYFYLKSKSNGSSDIEFTFSVKDLNQEELANLKENHSVNFWQKPNTNTVFIYRAGTMGGRGRIGIVPNKYSKQIIEDLQHDRTYVGEILSINTSDVLIRYRRPSSQKMKKIQKSYLNKRSQQLQQLLNKDYNPQKGFGISVNLDKTGNYEVGDPVIIRFKEKEHYIKNPQSLELDFYNQNDQKIANKSNHPDKIRRILRAYFNDYKIHAKISSIRDLDKYELKYYDRIPGAVRIDFEKNA